MKLRSPAKINLILNVLRRRRDGTHEIETVFERISLFDELRLSLLKDKSILLRTDSDQIPGGSSNLAWRAAKLLQQRHAVRKGVLIEINKRIPVAAGLGGGSSNAATVLLGLNQLWKLRLSKKELLRLGAELGSDVPFFILDTSFAVGRGRGEILRKVNAPKIKLWHCLVKPEFSILTKEAYASWGSAKLTPPKSNARMLFHSIRKGQLERLSKLLVNSLEAVLNKRFREILRIKNELRRQGAAGSVMSGSGSSVFGVFASKAGAEHAACFLRRQDKRRRVFVVSTY